MLNDWPASGPQGCLDGCQDLAGCQVLYIPYNNSFSDKTTLGICLTAFSSSPIMRKKSYAWDSPTARSLTKGNAMAKFAIQGAGDAKVTFSNQKVKKYFGFFFQKRSPVFCGGTLRGGSLGRGGRRR